MFILPCWKVVGRKSCASLRKRLLPPAKGVWGKVICLHLSVILSTGGGCLVQGVPGPEGCLVQGYLVLGVPGGDPPRWLLLQAVRILLECIFLSIKVFMLFKTHIRLLSVARMYWAIIESIRWLRTKALNHF